MGRGSHLTLGNVFYCMRQIIFGSAKAALSLQANGKRSVGSELGARGWGACTQQPRELAAEICRSVTDLLFFELFFKQSWGKKIELSRASRHTGTCVHTCSSCVYLEGLMCHCGHVITQKAHSNNVSGLRAQRAVCGGKHGHGVGAGDGESSGV